MTTPDAPPVTPQRLMQFAFAFAPPLMIETAVRLGLFDALTDGPRSLAQLQQASGASERGLRALLNGLVGLEFLHKDDGGRYRLAPESAAFLVSTQPSYLGGFFRHASSQLIPHWLELTQIVQTGRPASSVNQEEDGTKFFEQFVEDIFPTSYPAARALAAALPLEGDIAVLDLAAGSGVWGIALAQQSPGVRVTAVDWPGVLPVTERTVARFGLSDRFEYRAGDLLEAEFGTGFHVATLGHILHSEGIARSKTLLQKVFDALAPGGTIAIAEWLTNEERTAPPHALVFALNMLVNTEQGDTFSFGEIAGWLQEAGFTDIRSFDAPGPSPLILATKPTG